MHISDVHDYNPEPSDKVEQFIAEKRLDKIKAEIERLVDDEFDRLEEYANEFISQVAAARAERFLERVLHGESCAAMALLGDETNGSRYRQMGLDAGRPWASVIHGSLFETDGISIRRKIVEAHTDLIESERIKDLESIVDGLKQQIAKMEGEMQRLRDSI